MPLNSTAFCYSSQRNGDIHDCWPTISLPYILYCQIPEIPHDFLGDGIFISSFLALTGKDEPAWWIHPGTEYT